MSEMTNDRVLIGRRIKAARILAGMSQQQVADALGVSKMAVSKWERGKVALTSRHLLALGKTLEKPVDYFLWTLHIERADIENEIEKIISDYCDGTHKMEDGKLTLDLLLGATFVEDCHYPMDAVSELTKFVWNLVKRMQ